MNTTNSSEINSKKSNNTKHNELEFFLGQVLDKVNKTKDKIAQVEHEIAQNKDNEQERMLLELEATLNKDLSEQLNKIRTLQKELDKKPPKDSELDESPPKNPKLARAQELAMSLDIDCTLLSLVQWRNKKGEGVVFDEKKNIYQSPFEALQSVEWDLTPSPASRNNLDVVWPFFIEHCLGSGHRLWYRQTYRQDDSVPLSVTWKEFVSAFLDQFETKTEISYKPLESLLEYTNIRMDPANESLDEYFVRFWLARTAAEQPNNTLSAWLLIESLPEALRQKIKETLIVSREGDVIDSCQYAKNRARELDWLVYSNPDERKTDKISAPYTPRFFKENNQILAFSQ